MNFMGCKIRTFLKSLFSLWCGYRQDVNMENSENQICSTFGEKDKEGKKNHVCTKSSIFARVSPPNLVIKETLDVKAGHMLSTAGIKCQWRL